MSSRVDVVVRNGKPFTRRARSTALERGEHGLAAFNQGCRCGRCRSAFRNYHRLRYAEAQVLARGVLNRRVRAARAAEHLAVLRASGWSVRKIAAEVGCHDQTLTRIARKPGARWWSVFDARLLGIEPRPRARRERTQGVS